MLTSTALYKQAIHFPHQRKTIVDVIDASGTVLLADIPIVDGSVTASLTNRVTRSCGLSLASDNDRLVELAGFFPDSVTDPLSPTQAILRVRSGIRYADGSSEIFPLFVGRIHTIALADAGNVVVQANDRAQDVVDFRFENPRNSNTGQPILTQIQQLITEAVSGATFGPHDAADAETPQLTWDEDRGQAIDDLAEALGARWYTLGDGSFVVRVFPYDNGTVVQTLEDGIQGLLTAATITKTRSGVANSVTVVSERVDGTDPVRVTARNTVTGSATAYGDAYGRVSQIIKIQTPLTNSEAQRLARAQLNGATALTEQWSVSCVPDHTLEPGDPIRLRRRGRSVVQVIDSIRYPLGLGEMAISTRAFTTPPVTLGF